MGIEAPLDFDFATLNLPDDARENSGDSGESGEEDDEDAVAESSSTQTFSGRVGRRGKKKIQGKY
jgi:hypothetical protein